MHECILSPRLQTRTLNGRLRYLLPLPDGCCIGERARVKGRRCMRQEILKQAPLPHRNLFLVCLPARPHTLPFAPRKTQGRGLFNIRSAATRCSPPCQFRRPRGAGSRTRQPRGSRSSAARSRADRAGPCTGRRCRESGPDGAVLAAIDLRRLECFQVHDRLRNARLQLLERRLGIRVGRPLHAGQTRGCAAGVVGGDLHLARQREHVRTKARVDQHRRVDLLRLRMSVGFSQDNRKMGQSADEYRNRSLIHRKCHERSPGLAFNRSSASERVRCTPLRPARRCGDQPTNKPGLRDDAQMPMRSRHRCNYRF